MIKNKLLIILPLVFSLSFVGCLNNDPLKTAEPSKGAVESSSATTDDSKKEASTDSSSTDSKTSTDEKSKSENTSNTANTNDSSSKSSTNSTENSKTANTQVSAPASKVFITNKAVAKSFPFYFGMTLDDFRNTLKKNSIKSTNEIEITSTPTAPDYGNKVISTSNNLVFAFDKNSKLYDVSSDNNHDKATALGLKKGNSIEDMEKLYGKKYEKSKLEKDTLYEYNLGNQYIKILVNNTSHKVDSWSVSTVKFKNAK